MSEVDINLYAVRHLPSVANLSPEIVGGRTNHSPLAEGAEEASVEASLLLLDQGITPNIVVSSPALRTIKTGALVLPRIGCDIEPIVCDELQELDQGSWTGKIRAEVFTDEVKTRRMREGKDFRPCHDGESMNDVTERGHGWAAGPLGELIKKAGLVANNEPITVLLFGHGVWIRCFAAPILCLDADNIFNITIPNGSTSLFMRRSGSWTVGGLGRTISRR